MRSGNFLHCRDCETLFRPSPADRAPEYRMSARGVHAMNYGDITLWDIVFGTFRNPDDFAAEYGFWDGASRQLGRLLVGQDVTVPHTVAVAEPEAIPAELAAA